VLDLKYLTIDDLEKFAANLRERIEVGKAQTSLPPNGAGRWTDATLREDEKDLLAVEAEILERTLLQCENPGGATT